MGKSATQPQYPEASPESEAERQARQDRWRAEHSAFIAAYNRVVEEEGLPLETWRMF